MTTRLTYNLKQWVFILESLEDKVWKSCFTEVERRNGKWAAGVLWKKAKEAILATEEYNQPMFLTPLKEAILNKDTIHFHINEDHSEMEVGVFLRFTAGSISEYAEAVKKARQMLRTTITKKGKSDITKASEYWAKYVYGSRGDANGDDTESLYSKTMEKRFQYMVSPAPWWSLVDSGNVVDPDVTDDYSSAGSMNRGGTPYPAIAAQHFVDKAIKAINPRVNKDYQDTLEKARVEQEEIRYGGGKILDSILNVLEDLPLEPVDFGTSLARIEMNSRGYELYQAKFGKIGFRLQ